MAQNDLAILREKGMLRTDFSDSEHWEYLADRHLHSYTLPRWHEICTVGKMELWCDRLDLTDHEQVTNTTHEEFIALNQDWPLRSFVGLLLEQVEERNGAKVSTRSGDVPPTSVKRSRG